MNSRPPVDSAGIQQEAGNVVPASSAETRARLLKRAKRQAAPIAKPFVQDPDKSKAVRRGPLSEFVNNGDLRGLQVFCLLHAIISSGAGDNGWSTTLPIRTWARAFGITETATPRSASSAASKVLSRLEARSLITRQRRGRERQVTVTLLRPDGSGEPYSRPIGEGTRDRFLTLANEYWTDGWHEKLDLPALAMLLVALHEKPGFELVTARMPEWYGWSADTAERGFKSLEKLGILRIDRRTKKEELAPDGITTVNVYTLLPPFDRAAPKRTLDKPTRSQVGGKRSKKVVKKRSKKTRPSPDAPVADRAAR